MIEPFSIAIAKSVLDDVQDRLARTRWTDDFANEDWGYGANAAYIRTLAEHWRDHYDWCAREAMMNRFAHFRTEIDDIPIHFIHERGRVPIRCQSSSTTAGPGPSGIFTS